MNFSDHPRIVSWPHHERRPDSQQEAPLCDFETPSDPVLPARTESSSSFRSSRGANYCAGARWWWTAGSRVPSLSPQAATRRRHGCSGKAPPRPPRSRFEPRTAPYPFDANRKMLSNSPPGCRELLSGLTGLLTVRVQILRGAISCARARRGAAAISGGGRSSR